jgi:hypothetical protein
MRGRRGRTKLGSVLLGLFVVGGLLAGPQPALAADSGLTVAGEGLCMQRIFMGPGVSVSPSNKLNCTAEDIKIAEALSATCNGPNCVDSDTCEEGLTFDLNATFQVEVTANERYDAGFFFRIDGGDNARGDGTGATGICSLSWLTPPPPTNEPVLNLDGDTCGDLNAGIYTNITFSIPGVLCRESTTDPGRVSLPNCTSWHSNQGTQCDAPLTNASDTDRFDFKPDTKAKCVCDDTFSIPIGISAPEGTVTKTATQAVVRYSVTVTNTTQLALQVTALTDTRGGNTVSITSVAGDIVATTCSVPQNLAVSGQTGDSYSCTFDVKYANPGTGGDLPDTVTATLHRVIDGSDTTNDVDKTGSTTINIDLNVTTP